jgi:hypothetical protein
MDLQKILALVASSFATCYEWVVTTCKDPQGKGEVYVENPCFLVVRMQVDGDEEKYESVFRPHPASNGPTLVWPVKNLYLSYKDAVAVAKQLAEETPWATYQIMASHAQAHYCPSCKEVHVDVAKKSEPKTPNNTPGNN